MFNETSFNKYEEKNLIMFYKFSDFFENDVKNKFLVNINNSPNHMDFESDSLQALKIYTIFYIVHILQRRINKYMEDKLKNGNVTRKFEKDVESKSIFSIFLRMGFENKVEYMSQGIQKSLSTISMDILIQQKIELLKNHLTFYINSYAIDQTNIDYLNQLLFYEINDRIIKWEEFAIYFMNTFSYKLGFKKLDKYCEPASRIIEKINDDILQNGFNLDNYYYSINHEELNNYL